MTNNIICFIILFMLAQYSSQQEESNFILGKWVGESTTILLEGDTLRTKPNTLQMIFNKDDVQWGFSGNRGYETFQYSVSKGYLTIDGEKMELIELSDSILIYKRKILLDDNFDIAKFRKVEGLDW